MHSSAVLTILGAEPILPKDAEEGEESPGHEGEGVAARRLILKRLYTKEETFRCMTTLPEEMADADVVRQIVHAKWGIENNGIKDLKDNWYMEHNFHHDPNATCALLLILFIVYNHSRKLKKHPSQKREEWPADIRRLRNADER